PQVPAAQTAVGARAALKRARSLKANSARRKLRQSIHSLNGCQAQAWHPSFLSPQAGSKRDFSYNGTHLARMIAVRVDERSYLPGSYGSGPLSVRRAFMDSKQAPRVRTFLPASIIMMLTGWGGLYAILTNTTPTGGTRWAFFFVMILAL